MQKFNLKIKGGQLTFSSDTHKALFNQFLRDNDGKIAQVTRYSPVRSNQQNNFYWLYLGIIEAETGNNADDLHEYFKRKYLKPEFIRVFGKEMRIPGTTTKLSKSDFTEYLDKICAESGVAIPNPVEAGFNPH